MTETFPGHEPPTAEPTRPGVPLPATSARYGAFTDAVVAIAMTLLILPLMELVPEAAQRGLSTRQFVAEDQGQFISFLLSFALIAMFWFMHHRMFRADTPHSASMGVVNLCWMVTIVFLPVATAMTGAMNTDRLQILIYIGTLTISSWLLLVLTALQLRARRAAGLIAPNRTILAAPLAMSILFLMALVLAEIFPAGSYYFLFAMILTGLLRRVLVRLGLRS